MGFKRPDRKMERIAQNLRDGMTRNNIPREVQEQIVEYTKAFANYGFPESHAYSFALLAYASAYYMIHYRACFMAAMFNNYPLGFYNAATLVKDAQRHGLHFLPLDINRSDYLFKVEEVPVRTGNDSDRVLPAEKRVRIGLNFVRGLREEVGKKIVERRNAGILARMSAEHEHGPLGNRESVSDAHVRAGMPAFRHNYTSIADLIDRVPEINKREIRALSLAGALNFDNTIHRRQALWESEFAIQPKGDLFEKNSPPYEGGVAAASADGVVLSKRTSFLRRLEGLELVETDLKKTGISIGKHPMGFIREELTKRHVLSAHESKDLKKGQVVSVAGAAIIRQRPMTAKSVVFITLEDETGHSNFVVMPDTFEKYRAVINQNDYLIIRGIFEERGMLKAIHFESIDSFTAEIVSHNFR
jgi:error-prone DNA polymerase